MPHTAAKNTAKIYWRCDGNPALPALVLGNSLGTDTTLWDPVMPRLTRHFKVIRYDTRGHGASDTPPGPYTMAQLVDDLAVVVEAARLERFHYCGVSLGGMVGMAYAAQGGHRVDKLVLCNTATRFDRQVWDTRIERVQQSGMAGVADLVLDRFYTRAFIERDSTALHNVRNTLLALEPDGYIGCCAAIRDMDIAAGISAIDRPTLVITGSEDRSTPSACGTEIAAAITGATLHELPCAHIPMTEIPCLWADTLLAFLAPPTAFDEATRYDMGLARRKQVLGTDYVEQRLAATTPFTRRFQNLITRLAWGEIWASSRLDDQTRRLMVLSMTSALGRWEEFELHLEAALRAGVEPTLLEETLTQTAIYCGVPTANTAFAIASKVLNSNRK